MNSQQSFEQIGDEKLHGCMSCVVPPATSALGMNPIILLGFAEARRRRSAANSGTVVANGAHRYDSASSTVTNAGQYEGADVPQLYLSKVPDEMRMRLLGFEPVGLRPGKNSDRGR